MFSFYCLVLVIFMFFFMAMAAMFHAVSGYCASCPADAVRCHCPCFFLQNYRFLSDFAIVPVQGVTFAEMQVAGN